MPLQGKNVVSILDGVRSIVTSQSWERGPLYPVQVTTRLTGAANNQNVVVGIYGGYAEPPSVPLATINLSESEPEEQFIIYAPWRFINAKIETFDISKPGAVTVTFNALEE